MLDKAILRLIAAAACCIVFLSGCVGTSTLYSNVFVKPSQPPTEIRVLYLENQLVTSSSDTDLAIAALGYNDLPELLKERVPIVFGMNKISTAYATIPRSNYGQKEAIEAVKWARKAGSNPPLLIIQVVEGTVQTSNQYSNITVRLKMHANLFESNATTRIWTGQFQNTLSKALLGRIGFDNEFVDKLLGVVLEQMASDGIIALPGGKPLIPEPKASKV